jgi:hypothetical protein
MGCEKEWEKRIVTNMCKVSETATGCNLKNRLQTEDIRKRR